MLSAAHAPAAARLILLGAGTPFEGVTHSALRAVDGESRVLDWVLHAFAGVNPELVFVGGYQIAEVMARFPTASYVVNENWRETGSAASLRLAPLVDGADHFVCYSDIVMRRSLVERMCSCSDDAIVAAVDSSYPERYRSMLEGQAGRREKARAGAGNALLAAGYDLEAGGEIGEFVGLLRVPARLVPALRRELAAMPADLGKAHLAELTERLRAAGMGVMVVEARDEWSDLNSPRCLARFVMGTKAETLERLESMVRSARILPQVRFDVHAWRADADGVVRRIVERFAGQRLAVRSSAKTEDGFDAANAGAFESILDVVPAADAVRAAVDEVVASFGDARPDHQVLVQPMVQGVSASGVVLTRRLATGAPYYTVNYAQDGNTRAVTSGMRAELDTLVVLRGNAMLPEGAPPGIAAVLAAVQEVERLLHYDALDVEFAIGGDGKPALLQVRPLVVRGDRSTEDDEALRRVLRAAGERMESLRAPARGVAGKRVLWGSMPDWNPAEIIGVRPRALASSLYLHLITNEVWAEQRAQFGYRDLRPHPLIRLFAGQPYVDVRASLNSFIPAQIPDAEAAALVDHCIAYLREHPELHDKVEFQVIPTCYDLDFDRWRGRLGAVLGDAGFARIAEGLRAITTRAFGRIDDDLAAVTRFAGRASPPADAAPLERAVLLIESCRRNGTLPFAHLARAAFIAVTLLDSAVRRGALSAARRAEFLESLETVSKEFRRDARRVREGAMAFGDLVARYGHLRPGTYEITSERYAAAPGRYLAPSVERAEHEPARPFAWTREERKSLDAAFGDARLPVDSDGFERFARATIAGRESSKFEFTRGLSEALELIAAFGESLGLSREQLSHVPYEDLRAAALGTAPGDDIASYVAERAERGRRWARIVESVELPPLLDKPDDFAAFRYPHTVPNFVTTKSVTAPPVDGSRPGSRLGRAIALIPQADPGYDWLFGQGIAGLITMFGGANSHMAIRAAELGLPAAIGVGEPRFETLSRATMLQLDCGARRISVEG